MALLDSRLPDEPYMLARSLKNVVVLVDKDRVKSAQHAIRRMDIDTLILTTACSIFICAIGWTFNSSTGGTFGNEHLLPGGLFVSRPVFAARELHLHHESNGADNSAHRADSAL